MEWKGRGKAGESGRSRVRATTIYQEQPTSRTVLRRRVPGTRLPGSWSLKIGAGAGCAWTLGTYLDDRGGAQASEPAVAYYSFTRQRTHEFHTRQTNLGTLRLFSFPLLRTHICVTRVSRLVSRDRRILERRGFPRSDGAGSCRTVEPHAIHEDAEFRAAGGAFSYFHSLYRPTGQ